MCVSPAVLLLEEQASFSPWVSEAPWASALQQGRCTGLPGAGSPRSPVRAVVGGGGWRGWNTWWGFAAREVSLLR